jgi:hypothetical protein
MIDKDAGGESFTSVHNDEQRNAGKEHGGGDKKMAVC